MSFTISAVTYDDAAGVSMNNMTAFYHTDTHWRALWKSMPLDKIIEGATARMPHSLVSGREKKRHQKAVDADSSEIVGYARWILPDDDNRISWSEAAVREPSQEEADKFQTAFQANTEGGSIKGMDGKLQAALGLPLEEAEVAAMRSQEGPFLDYLAVHPDHRRKGIASVLVRNGIEQADAVGMKVWVMATKTAQPMYEKLGFELVDSVRTSVTEFGISEPHEKAFLMKR
ncbi:hypothetical protein CSAL01_00079 [Colletotrichum salicis]|uniref:N-acetyltransferase domain-containing protein n=1 Tax=Colletotrichum salicis TaxID=1209931 RepID=A0A135V8J7_9PEZI|nr:hypothetical protein CSAL01_00079 [Colletotrichum salicis]